MPINSFGQDVAWFCNRAVQAAGKIGDPQARVDALLQIADVQGRAKALSDLHHTLDLAQAAAASLSPTPVSDAALLKIWQRRVSSRDIAGAKATAGAFAEADKRAALEQAIARIPFGDPQTTHFQLESQADAIGKLLYSPYNSGKEFAVACAEAGDSKGAIAAMAGLSGDILPWTQMTVAEGLSHCGDFADALATAESIKDYRRALTLAEVVEYAGKHNLADSQRVIQNLLADAAALQPGDEQATRYENIAS
ncbi:MAG: hypothetical protein ABSH22_13230, partial [Tepidisphaeraceae bacterium]